MPLPVPLHHDWITISFNVLIYLIFLRMQIIIKLLFIKYYLVFFLKAPVWIEMTFRRSMIYDLVQDQNQLLMAFGRVTTSGELY